MRKILKIAAFTVLCLCFAFNYIILAQTTSQNTGTDKIIIKALSIKRFPSLNLIVAEGNVEITYKDVKLNADRVKLNTETKDLIATGNVTIWERESYLKCDRIEFNLDTKKGVAYRARGFFSPYYYFKGKKIVRASENVYNVYKGELTTCETCRGEEPDWKFKGKKIIINTKSFTRIYGFSGWIKKIPVIYSPYLLIPVKKERKTGFLRPKFGYKSSLGAFVRVPFFWAISRSQDATIWFTPYTDGSTKIEAEYRQLFSEEEKLYVRGGYLNEISKSRNKWDLTLSAYKKLWWDTELIADADIKSTSKYKKEFSSDFEGLTKRYNDSYIQLLKRFTNARISLLARWKDDLEYGYEERTDRLPELDIDFYPTKIFSTPFYIEGKGQFLRYRDKNDTLKFDHTMVRFDLFPKISLPITPVPWLSIVPKFGIRHTVWNKHLDREGDLEDGTISRTIYTFETRIKGPLLYKEFTLFGKTIRHDVIPEIVYKYTPDERKDQEDIYYFDETDYMPPENIVTYSLTHRFFEIGEKLREVAKIKLEQSYDIYRDRRGLPYKFSDILFETDFYPAKDIYLRNRIYQSVHGDGVTRWDISGKISHSFKNGYFVPSLKVSYYYVKHTEERFIKVEPTIKLDSLTLTASFKRDLFYDYWIEKNWGITYKRKCWSITFSYRTVDNRYNSARNDKKFMIFITLRGIGSFGKRK